MKRNKGREAADPSRKQERATEAVHEQADLSCADRPA